MSEDTLKLSNNKSSLVVDRGFTIGKLCQAAVLLIAVLMFNFVIIIKTAQAENVQLSVFVLKDETVHTINDFDFSTVNVTYKQ
jgi:predicted phosphoribosyltransferase